MGSPAPKPLDLLLECSVETQSEYELGKPITVKGILHNSGSSAIWILSWNTLLEPQWHNCFSLTHSGSRVPYIGDLASRGNPGRESYLRIPAGESVSRQVDICENYEITQPGDYQIAFRMPLLFASETRPEEWPQDASQYKWFRLESATVTFRMVGAALATSREKSEALYPDEPTTVSFDIASSFPTLPKPPIFRGLRDEEVPSWTWSHYWAYQTILAAWKSAQANTPSSFYNEWLENFGVSRPLDERETSRQIVIKMFEGMARRMSTNLIAYQTASRVCEQEQIARTTVNGAVDLCPPARDNDFVKALYGQSVEWGRRLIIVHELSHHVGTEDLSYDINRCKLFAYQEPAAAVANAHNYALFAMGTNPVPPPSIPPPDNGIWRKETMTGLVSGSTHSPAAASMVAEIGGKSVIVMLAYREKSRYLSRLWYKVLLLKDGGAVWQDAKLFNVAGNSTGCRSLLSPALAVSGATFYCAYVDLDSRDLVCVRAEAFDQLGTPIWPNLVWSKREVIGRSPWEELGVEPGPALAEFRGSIYCVYVDAMKRLQGATNMTGSWRTISDPSFNARQTNYACSLFVFKDQLKCAYFDIARQRNVMLTYQPAPEEGRSSSNLQTGTWREDGDSNLRLEMESITLAQWNTAQGPKLMAIGKGKDGDWNLHYALSENGKDWAPQVRMTDFSSPLRPALVGSGSGSPLYSFHRRQDDLIEAIVARGA